ncbi:hypothetical protein [Streptomyces sp. URMC 123]|uniref:hypothetical protein n=1 Tax=Streptomyces sp. URMC 123 TaxID=3423403 RepID=UPI003F1DCC04
MPAGEASGVTGAGSEAAPAPARGDGRGPVDEDAAWAAIIAGYGEEPPDPPGAEPWPGGAKPPVERLPGERAARDEEPADGRARPAPGTPAAASPDKPVGSFIVRAPGLGPRDWEAREPSDDDFDDTDEGHFVPPEPPPLPKADATAKFAWIAVLGGPLLLLLTVLLRWDMTWWIGTLGIGGFIGGFATLVVRMKDGDEDEDDPGRGAVV